jgi:hypothetical protein
MDDENVVEKLDLKHSCFEKALLLEWRNGKTYFLKMDFMSITSLSPIYPQL